ncbi:Ger(x)C family spore germination protein [Lentibacillus sp.]|uniref:Ger(x)C family spore germination protein n=1 Tax=Lentibacillus sp. TaxID=1925746 RepID=UPI002B4AB2FF|nr:Ger(x)C family spore germination protein [Lentibacillus sp.]HLS08424.1 Ger(x)C family spore germination protein [Lentibacillus sp.]
MKQLYNVLVCLLMLLLAGCWDRMEVNDLAIVVGMGLHKTDDDLVELSVQMVNPSSMASGQGGGGAQQGTGQLTTVEKDTGKTTFDASSTLQEKISRKVFVGHNRVVFISEKMAEKGIRKHIDFLARHPEPRLRSYVFVTKGAPADFFKVMPDLETSSAETARELAILKIGMSVEVKDLLQMTADGSENAALPILEIEEESPDTYGLSVSGTAVFKNGKMVGQLDNRVTRGALWIRNEINNAAVTVRPEGTEGYISFNIFEARTKLVPKIKNGNWTMTINVQSIDDAVENETTLNLKDPDTIKRLEKQLEERIDKRIRTALEHVQQDMQADILGFGEVFHRQYPGKWAKVKDNWNEATFPEITVNIKSDVNIKRPGRSTSPPAVPDDEVTDK